MRPGPGPPRTNVVRPFLVMIRRGLYGELFCRSGYCAARISDSSMDNETAEIDSRQVHLDRLLEHFANSKPCIIGVEAFRGSQH